MDLEVGRRSIRGWTVLTLSGELDLHTSPSLHDEIRSMIEGTPRVAVDLSEIAFMDSTALGVLVSAAALARERSSEFSLVGVTGSPARVLALTGMDEIFEMVDHIEDLPER